MKETRPAMTAVFGPGPNRGRMPAYVNTITNPRTKSTRIQGRMPAADVIALGSVPNFCAMPAMSSLTTVKLQTVSQMLATTPASRPPATTRPVLIDAIRSSPVATSRLDGGSRGADGSRYSWGEYEPWTMPAGYRGRHGLRARHVQMGDARRLSWGKPPGVLASA